MQSNVSSPLSGVTRGQHSFAQVPSAEIQRSSFDRSCGLKTTFDAGFLVPVFLDEALPGDTMSMSMSTFARLTTPITAFMDNLYLDVFWFAVPNRLVWDNWERFNGSQDDPGDSTDFEIPTITTPVGGHTEQSLSDYFGIPTKVHPITHSALFHRGYNLIWNSWFRSEDLQDSVVVDKDDGPDSILDYVLLKRGKRHDYFTSALPFLQKGPAVEMPLGTFAPVVWEGPGVPTFTVDDATDSVDVADSGLDAGHWILGTLPTSAGQVTWADTALQANLGAATAATINELRESFQIQRLFERDARGGTRYTEVLRSHFGVVSPDQRLQRPEYLGGGSVMMRQNIAQATAFTSPLAGGQLGDVSSTVVGAQVGTGFNKSFVEHCMIFGLVCMRADLNYQQGLEKMFSRSKRFDFYWPALAHLGEQAIMNKEIFADGTANDELTFGYQERYAEYRYKPSKITGIFRSNAATPLDFWHLAQDFAALPVLNASFIEEDPPVDRVVTTPSEPHVLFDAYFMYRCARPMPTFSVPGLIDHF